jgi:lipopolysaccharide export system protein LptC
MVGHCKHGVKFVSQVNNYHLHREDMNNYERRSRNMFQKPTVYPYLTGNGTI